LLPVIAFDVRHCTVPLKDEWARIEKGGKGKKA